MYGYNIELKIIERFQSVRTLFKKPDKISQLFNCPKYTITLFRQLTHDMQTGSKFKCKGHLKIKKIKLNTTALLNKIVEKIPQEDNCHRVFLLVNIASEYIKLKNREEADNFWAKYFANHRGDWMLKLAKDLHKAFPGKS